MLGLMWDLGRFRVDSSSPLLSASPVSGRETSASHVCVASVAVTAAADQRSTHPCPIFSKRVYFFLGSPTLTMLPESQRKQK